MPVHFNYVEATSNPLLDFSTTLGRPACGAGAETGSTHIELSEVTCPECRRWINENIIEATAISDFLRAHGRMERSMEDAHRLYRGIPVKKNDPTATEIVSDWVQQRMMVATFFREFFNRGIVILQRTVEMSQRGGS